MALTPSALWLFLALIHCHCLGNGTESNHWAFQPILQPALPPSPFSNPIDRFLFRSIAANSVAKKPLPPAERRTILRRLSFDLRGLPPSPDEVQEFLNDSAPDSDVINRWLDRWQQSPEYGERWGRHWLDWVGYADSNGYFSADSDRPLAWKYRDYVVRSIQTNKPLDRFIHEQIAGDELAGYVAGGDVTEEMVEPLTATHFWRNAPDGSGESDGNPLEVKVDRYAVLEGNVQLVGATFLGLTLQCARCHDHKFEPITQDDYYALQAILRPSFDPDRWLKPNERVVEIGLRPERVARTAAIAKFTRERKTLQESSEGLIAQFRKQWVQDNLATLDEPRRKEIQAALDAKEKDRTAAMKQLLKQHAELLEVSEEKLCRNYPVAAEVLGVLREALDRNERLRPAPLERVAGTFESTNTPPIHHLLTRGNHATEGPTAESHLPKALAGDSAWTELDGQHRASTGRRLALARWLTSTHNPLTARVLANRIWEAHFGRGLVQTVDNLGRSGARPEDPELLDWLAAELIRSGWNLRSFHRLILTSVAYQQLGSAPAFAHPRRLDAESVRDAMLLVSGELDRSTGGSFVPNKVNPDGQIVVDEKQAGAFRRSLYLQQRRTQPVDFLGTFDGPAHHPVCIQRVPSTVPQQSLSLLNSEFVRTRARAMARRLLTLAPSGSTAGNVPWAFCQQMVTRGFSLSYGRPPTESELSQAEQFLQTQRAIYAQEADAPERVWTDFCQILFASNEFLYVD